MKKIKKDIDISKLLQKNEFKSLKGKGNQSLIVLTVILLITILALGHVIGGLNVLERSMNNPFTNWINVANSKLNGPGNEKILEKEGFLKDSFDLNSIFKYEIDTKFAKDSKFNREINIVARNVGINDPINKAILSNKNVKQKFDIDNNACSVIITKEALKTLGFKDGDPINYLALMYDIGGNRASQMMLIPISAIVYELPNEVDIIMPDQLWKLMDYDEFIELGNSNKLTFISQEKIILHDLKKMDLLYLPKEEPTIDREIIVNGENYFVHELWFENKLLNTDLDSIRNQLIKNKQIIPFSEYDCSNVNKLIEGYYYSYNFNTLDKVSQFKDYAKSFGVDIPLHQVKSKENFVIVSRIANLFIILLVIFSALSIVLYIRSLLKNHLEKIKPNLGTLKAFGLSDNDINKIYLTITLKFFIIASVFAFIIAFIYHFVFKLVKVKTMFFNLYSPWIFIGWIFILIFLIISYKTIIQNILFKSPGDLIYNR